MKHLNKAVVVILATFLTLLPYSSFAQSESIEEKPVLFPKLFGLNKSFSVGLIGAGIDGFEYGAIGVNATYNGVYVDFMGWPRKSIDDVNSENWEELSVWSSHVGYQIPFHKYLNGSMRLIPMIGYYSKKEGAENKNYGNPYRVTSTTGGFDYGAALALQSKDDKLGYFNFYVGVTRYTTWVGLGVDFIQKRKQDDEINISTKPSSRKVSFGIIGAALDRFNYGAIGLNASLYNIYFDFMGWPRKYANDVRIDKWEDHSCFAFHAGYQIPLHSCIGLAPIIGYAKIKKGVTDGSDWDITNGTINNSFRVEEELGGFDYGVALVLHSKKSKIGSVNFSLAYTRYTAYAGLGYDFPF